MLDYTKAAYILGISRNIIKYIKSCFKLGTLENTQGQENLQGPLTVDRISQIISVIENAINPEDPKDFISHGLETIGAMDGNH